MLIRPEHYLSASTEKVEGARRLHEDGRYAQAIYFAGVATECMLRAYRTRRDPEFDSRHDLLDLVRASGISELVPENSREQFSAHLGDIWSRWKNNYRYASEERLKSEYKTLKFDRGIRGDYMKENSRIVVEAALFITGIGALKWKKSFGS